MKWTKEDESLKIPIKSWCEALEPGALEQAKNLANHPVTLNHIALMPDAHVGYGMPIGGVIATENAIIPNAVGVDIGCGMGAIKTNFVASELKEKSIIRKILDDVKSNVPVGEGNSRKTAKEWIGFPAYLKSIDVGEDIDNYKNPKLPAWFDKATWTLAFKNLGTLGGGNHFIEMQVSQDGYLWLMLHSGSRNIGNRIALYYHKLAQELNEKYNDELPDIDLAFFRTYTDEGNAYIRDMNFAMEYAQENRRLMMEAFKQAIINTLGEVEFLEETNIHHNYAALENHFDKSVWVHRKGATSAKAGEKGIIPGSMGTSSYIVEGLGNVESFQSCSHGAGRKMGRMDACRTLTAEECDEAMGDVVYDRWGKLRKFGRKIKGGELFDLSESPLAYKNIEEVIEAELDLIKPLVKLRPIGVLKG
jgi:tRNA-splicing ligase RtcB (3'-phosphate/5'-hydroxy nucleic acid ligase)